jgi:16S rRNA (guanine1207-N2)-methyltransferase
MNDVKREGVYGAPPGELVEPGPGAIQFSPLVPGAEILEDEVDRSLAGMTMLAPPGTVERRYALAQSLRALTPDALLTVLAPKDKGGSRIGKELTAFGCAVTETSRRHHRICTTRRPPDPVGISEALEQGSPRVLEATGLWSQPGVFSWDRIDPGSASLVKHMPQLAGRGADLGCGIGYLSQAVLRSPGVTALDLVDIDRRAVDMARRNVGDLRARFSWADIKAGAPALEKLDFVVMNPPFHDGGIEDKALGQTFVRRAADLLRRGGACWLTANRHLPYEGVMGPLFQRVVPIAEEGGYKIYMAVK